MSGDSPLLISLIFSVFQCGYAVIRNSSRKTGLQIKLSITLR